MAAKNLRDLREGGLLHLLIFNLLPYHFYMVSTTPLRPTTLRIFGFTYNDTATNRLLQTGLASWVIDYCITDFRVGQVLIFLLLEEIAK